MSQNLNIEELENLRSDLLYASKGKEAKEDEQIKLAMLKIKHKYGKNAILKGMNLQERATTRERNRQIGGHHE